MFEDTLVLSHWQKLIFMDANGFQDLTWQGSLCHISLPMVIFTQNSHHWTLLKLRGNSIYTPTTYCQETNLPCFRRNFFSLGTELGGLDNVIDLVDRLTGPTGFSTFKWQFGLKPSHMCTASNFEFSLLSLQNFGFQVIIGLRLQITCGLCHLRLTRDSYRLSIQLWERREPN